MRQYVMLVVDAPNAAKTYKTLHDIFPDNMYLDVKVALNKYDEIVMLINVLKNITGWTDERIADELGYARSTIQKWKTQGLHPGSFHQDEIIEQLEELIRRNG